MLRIDSTVNGVSFFKHHCKVEHKSATATRELASLTRSICGLLDLRGILAGCYQRCLALLSSLDDSIAGELNLKRLSQLRLGSDPSIECHRVVVQEAPLRDS